MVCSSSAWVFLLSSLVFPQGCAREAPPAAVPAYRGEGEELIGRAWRPDGLAWLDGAPADGATLVRWWTEG